MTEKTGIVFSIAEINEPPRRSVVENTVYENYGYQVRHYSIAKDMTIVPERYTHHTLYYINQGVLHIEYKVDDVPEEIIVEEGKSIIRPAYMLCGFRADEDCVFTELILPSTSNISPLLREGKIFCMPDMISFRQNDTYEIRLIDDRDLQFSLHSLDAGTKLQIRSDMTYIFVTILDGEGEITEKDSTYSIAKGESFCSVENEVTLSSAGRMKLMVLYCR
ncbi:MAG: hypothetical protein K6G61_12025 [Solobacterium sp.]|nr:hypothetical protein [Solobacterium sp.]